MYNEEIKNRWCEATNSAMVTMENFFNVMGPIEAEAKTDLAELPTETLIKGLEAVATCSTRTTRLRLSMLKSYIRWYSENVKAVPSHALSIKTSDVDFAPALKRELFKTEGEILKYESWFPANEGYLCFPFYILAWMGLTLREILTLADDDVTADGDLVIVNFGGERLYHVSADAARIIRDYKTCLVGFRPDVSGNGRSVEYIKTDRFYRTYRFPNSNPKPASDRRADTVLSQAATTIESEKPIVMTKIILSGRLNRLYISQIQSGRVSDALIIKEFRIKDDREYQMQVNDTRKLLDAYKRAFWQ